MKKAISWILTIALLFSLMPTGIFTLAAQAELVTGGFCGDNLEWLLYDDGTLTISGTGDMMDFYGTYAVPWNSYCSSIDTVIIGPAVTSIGNFAFANCSGLTGAFTIPDSVTRIGEGAFFYCTGLTSVIIPDSVTSIGPGAFRFCTSLLSVTIGSGVKNIEPSAFEGCKGLTGELRIPNSVTSIGEYALRGCTGINEIYFEGSAPVIDNYAFSEVTATAYYYPDETWTEDVRQNYGGTITWVARQSASEGLEFTLSSDGTYYSVTGIGTCKNTDIVIPDTHEGKPVKAIGNYAFYVRTGLTSVTIPDSVETIGKCAFDNCRGLISVTIGNSVTSIGDEAFRYCTSLTSVSIPNRVTSIGNSAFANCASLTGELTIPDSVTSIGDKAFYSCSGWSSLSIGERVETIGQDAFLGCTGLVGELIIPNSVTSIGEGAFFRCAGLTSVTIGNGIKTIFVHAFYECTSLTSMTIWGSATSIDSYAFYGCTALKELYFEGSAPVIDNYAFPGVTATAYYYPDETWTEDVMQDYGYGTITWVALERASEGLEFTLSSDGTYYSVTGIGTCTDTDIVIPSTHEGKPVKAISNNAFKGNKNIASVKIPTSVTSIGQSAFRKCASLTGIWVDSGNTKYSSDEYGVLFNNDKTTLIQAPGQIAGSYTIPNSVTSIGFCAFEGCTGLTGELIIPDSVRDIGDSAFWGCDGLTSVTIGNNVMYIRGLAFAYCTGLTGQLIIPDSVYYIGDNAFVDCSGLAAVTIGSNVTSISYYAFYNCTGLTGELIIPNSVTSIGSSAFEYCSGLTSVTIGSGVKTIEQRTFSNCTGLTSVTIGSNVESLGDGAFIYCTGLKEISFEGSAPTIGSNAFQSVTATAYYYPDETWTEDVRQNYGGNITWVALNQCEHDFTEWMPIELDGVSYKIRACKKCGYIETDLPEDVVHLHDWQLESKSPTCTEPGYKDYIWCKNCDLAVSKVTIDPLGHDDSGEWQKDETGHWKICQRTECGVMILKTEHNYGSWITDVQATCETSGHKHRTCNTCGYVQQGTTTIPGHDYNGAWHYDASGHWKICQRAGCGKKLLADGHTLNKGEVTEPTCTEQGYTTYYCQCGYTEKRDFNGPLEHIPGSWQYNSTHHWKICRRPECGEKINVESHAHSKGAQTSATCTEQGYTAYTCECGHSENRDFYGPLVHDCSGSWQCNDTHHWKTCQRPGCGTELDRGEHDFAKVKVDATCTEDGYTTYSCDCGYTDTRDVEPAPGHDDSGKWYYNDDQHWKICDRDNCDEKILKAGHSYGNWVVDTEAKCETAGSKHRTCTTCGYVQRETITIPGHDESGSWHYDANGHWKICQRSGCGEKILAAGHSLQKGEVKDPTCTEQGYTTYHCVCGYSVKKDFTDAKIHDESGEWLHSDTQHWKICQRPECGETILLANHQHNTLVDSVSATCTEQGYSIYACQCEHTEKRDFYGPLDHDRSGPWQCNDTHHWKICQRPGCGAQLEKAEHTLKTKKVEVTCTADGYTTDYCDCGYCTDPYDVVTAPGHDSRGAWYHNDAQHWKICQNPGCGEKILVAGHSYGEWVEDVPAGCETAGSKHRTCTECGYIQQEVIPKLDHIQSGAWHYDADGHWQICQRPGCGEKINEADHIHDIKGEHIDPTCTEQGYTIYNCECGHSEGTNFEDSLGHKPGESWMYDEDQHWKICERCKEKVEETAHNIKVDVKEVTCTEDGYTTYSCGCGYYDIRDVEKAPDHDESGEWVQGTDSHWKICKRPGCGEMILVADHSYGEWVEDVPAGCETAGSKHRVCTDCGYIQQGEISALGHDDSGPWQQDADGHWKICNRDGCNEKIRAAGHSYGNWITDKAAECEKEGTKHRTCLCGYTEYGTIPKLDHDRSGAWQQDDTNHWKVCDSKNCDEILDKSKHNYGDYVLKTTKTTQNGSTVFVHCVVSECKTCGYEWTSDSTSVHAHEKVIVIPSKEPTCTEPGNTAGLICAECGKILIAITAIPVQRHDFMNGTCTVCGEEDLGPIEGVYLFGSYISYGEASNAVTVQLIPSGETEAVSAFVSDGTSRTGVWSIGGVLPGSYTVRVMKKNHVTREYTLTVGESDAALNLEIWLLGDVTGDGLVNFSDCSKVLSQSKNPSGGDLSGYTWQCGNVTGDSIINFSDYSQVLAQAKGSGSLWED